MADPDNGGGGAAACEALQRFAARSRAFPQTSYYDAPLGGSFAAP